MHAATGSGPTSHGVKIVVGRGLGKTTDDRGVYSVAQVQGRGNPRPLYLSYVAAVTLAPARDGHVLL